MKLTKQGKNCLDLSIKMLFWFIYPPFQLFSLESFTTYLICFNGLCCQSALMRQEHAPHYITFGREKMFKMHHLTVLCQKIEENISTRHMFPEFFILWRVVSNCQLLKFFANELFWRGLFNIRYFPCLVEHYLNLLVLFNWLHWQIKIFLLINTLDN